MTALDRVTDALVNAGMNGRGSSWQCPAHEDRSPSLSVRGGSKGAGVVLHCHAGCATEDVVGALGLTMADLFDEPHDKPRERNRPFMPRRKVAQSLGRKVAEYPYCDESGELLFVVERYDPKDFRQRAADGTRRTQDIRKVPYRLPEVVAQAQGGGTVCVVEGEKDADALAAAGAVATCNPGGAGKWRDEYGAHFLGAAAVVVIADRDDPGRQHAAQVAASLRRAGVTVRVMEPAKGKDVTDHIEAGLGFDDLVPIDPGPANPGIPGPSHPANGEALARAGGPDKTDRTRGAAAQDPGAGGSVSSVRVNEAVREWEPPVPIDRPPLPGFPVELLGANLPRMVEAVARATQVSPDLPVMMALPAITTALGGRCSVRIREGWVEPVLLWTAAVALPGERKTAVEDRLTQPIREAERLLRDEAAPQIEETKQRRRIAEERVKDAERAAIKAKGDTAHTAADDARIALRQLHEIGEVPAPPSLLWGDITPAAMPIKAAENDGRGALIDSEGTFFKNVTGQRFSGNASSDTSFALKAYDGKAEPVQRVQREGTELTRAYLTLGLLVQPVILESLARNETDEVLHNGFVQRFLYSHPESNLGKRNPRGAVPVPEHVAHDYNRRIHDLIQQVWKREHAFALPFTDDGNELMYLFEEELEPRLDVYGDLRPVMSWASKLPAKLARIAAALTLFDDPRATEVTSEYVKNALDLAPYFIRHARLCLDLMGANREARLTPARDVLEWLRRRARPDEPFTVRDVQRGVFRKWAEDGGADAIRSAVEHLADLGWVAAQPAPEREPGTTGRKPSQKYDVHPWVHTPPKDVP